MNQELLPALDTKILAEKATEFAMKGAIKSIEDYYSGYESPFKKAITEELKNKGVNLALELPDIIAVINEALSKEIDAVANAAVAQTFIPMVKKFLIRAEKEMKFSEILEAFVEEIKPDYHDCEIDIEESRYGWLDVKIKAEESTWEFTMHTVHETEKLPVKKYQILSLPRVKEERYGRTMKLSIEGASLEIPFTRDVLSDNFNAFIAKLVLANTHITLDTEEFSSEMFPNDVSK